MSDSLPAPDDPVTSPATGGIRDGHSRTLVILVGAAAVTIVIAGLRNVAEIAGPVLIALVLSIAAGPIRTALTRHGLPRWVATTATVLALYFGLALLTGAIIIAAAQFAELVPAYSDEFNNLLSAVSSLLREIGISSEQVQAMLASIDLSRLARVATALLSGSLALLTNFAFIVALVLFLCLDATAFNEQLNAIRARRPGFVEAMNSFARGTRTYLLVATVFGLVVAIIDVMLLWLLGIPAALLWGLLAFITNYIPNIGFVLGLIPPAVLALLEGGPGLMLAVILAYSIINVLIQSVIQPKIVGDAVGLSASVTFLALVAWAWILGPSGAILAVPLTLFVKALFIDVDPRTRWVGGLLGDHKLDNRRPT